MPSEAATACSIGVVMKPCIRSGDAPGYTVVTVITVLVSLGYCRIGRLVAALKPISRISSETTTASTGRLMKISVKDMRLLPSVQRRLGGNLRRRIGRDRHQRARLQLELADRDHAVARLDALGDHRAAVDAIAGAHEG